MPGPPTPVSACPLKRLEIRDGISTRSYTSAPPTSVFTLTLEGERAIDAETGTLILLIHHGQQRLISIRLTDLLKISPGGTDIVAIDKVHLQLCVRVPKQSHAILAQFEEFRDFSVAACMLKKSNFVIHDSVSSVLSAPAPGSQTADPLTFDTASSFGPRLSSLTSFPQALTSFRSNSLGSQEPASFTELLNSPDPIISPMPTFIQPTPPPQPYSIQRMHSFPDRPTVGPSPLDSTALSIQLNPYNMFLGRNDSLYRPRVSSPLKQSFNPGELSRHPSNASLDSNTSLSNTYVPANTQHAYHSIATPAPLGSVAPLGPFPSIEEYHNANAYEVVSPAASLMASGAPLTLPIRTNQKVSPDKDFRDLMPQPRKLPFDSPPKEKALAEAAPKKQDRTKKIPLEKAQDSYPKSSGKESPRKLPEPKQSPARVKPRKQERMITASCKPNLDTVSKSSRNVPPKRLPQPTRRSPANMAPKKQTSVKERTPKKVPNSVAESLGSPPIRKLPFRQAKRSRHEELPKEESRIKSAFKQSNTGTINDATNEAPRPVPKKQKFLSEDQQTTSNAAIQPETVRELLSTTCSPSPPQVSSPVGLSHRPILLLADSDTLMVVNQEVDRLIEQYKADVADSTDKAATARFYMDQIQSVRRNFWYAKLTEREPVRRPMVV